MGDAQGTGGSQVVTYLSGVDEGQVDALVEDLCDLLRAHGLATNANDDSDVRSVVAVRPFAWPPDPEDMLHGHLADAALFIVPTVIVAESDD